MAPERIRGGSLRPSSSGVAVAVAVAVGVLVAVGLGVIVAVAVAVGVGEGVRAGVGGWGVALLPVPLLSKGKKELTSAGSAARLAWIFAGSIDRNCEPVIAKAMINARSQLDRGLLVFKV